MKEISPTRTDGAPARGLASATTSPIRHRGTSGRSRRGSSDRIESPEARRDARADPSDHGQAGVGHHRRDTHRLDATRERVIASGSEGSSGRHDAMSTVRKIPRCRWGMTTADARKDNTLGPNTSTSGDASEFLIACHSERSGGAEPPGLRNGATSGRNRDYIGRGTGRGRARHLQRENG